MKAAFNTSLLPRESTAPSEEEDGSDLWKTEADVSSMEAVQTERLSCFAHTLQLSVADGLKETKAISLALSKATKLTSHLHRSTKFKVRNKLRKGSV